VTPSVDSGVVPGADVQSHIGTTPFAMGRVPSV